MSMSKRDFEALADALYGAKPQEYDGVNTREAKLVKTTWDTAFIRVANVCAFSNGQFDRSRFHHRSHFGHNLTQKCCPKSA